MLRLTLAALKFIPAQCTPQELAVILPAFNKIGTAFDLDNFEKPEDVGFSSPLLNQIIFSLPKIKEPVQSIIKEIHLKKAADGELDSLWTDFDKYPAIAEADMVGHCASCRHFHLHV